MEKILTENPGRFVIFPIEHNDIWEYYKQHQAPNGLSESVKTREPFDPNESCSMREP